MNPRKSARALGFLVVALLAQPAWSARAGGTEYVIHTSVDGLHGGAISALGPALAPNFHRLRSEGAWTDNARTDVDDTSTVPNHATQLTARGVLGPDGHEWTINGITTDPTTIHSNKGSYVASVFDVAHDAGLKTGLYAMKEKFILFDRSWNETYGAPDPVPPDHGPDKIDRYVEDYGTVVLPQFMADMPLERFNYVLLHLDLPDTVGHGWGWDLTPGSPYLDAVVTIDGVIGDLLAMIEADPQLAGRTALIVTADHGGELGTTGHPPVVGSMTIPFYVWGPGVASGADLYALNPISRADPGAQATSYADPVQPIRSGEAANLALDLLGLGAIAGSTMNAAQELVVTAPPVPVLEPRGVGAAVLGALLLLAALHRGRRSSRGAARRETSGRRRGTGPLACFLHMHVCAPGPVRETMLAIGMAAEAGVRAGAGRNDHSRGRRRSHGTVDQQLCAGRDPAAGHASAAAACCERASERRGLRGALLAARQRPGS